MTGELVGAYALSESGSGSDALGARARATRQPDGSFVLNGEKMWITNGGFADVFIVFAKVDGEQFTAFIVERAFGGVTAARKSTRWACTARRRRRCCSRTCACRPRNLLGEIGKGHKVAFNVLNFGRFKLGAMCRGGCQGGDRRGRDATPRARRQFGAADRVVRRDPAQARRDDGAHLRGRERWCTGPPG